MVSWFLPPAIGVGFALFAVAGGQPELLPALLVALLGLLVAIRRPDWALYLMVATLPLNTMALPIKGLRMKICQALLLLAIAVWSVRAVARQQDVRLPGVLIPFAAFLAITAAAATVGVSWRAPALFSQWLLFFLTVLALANLIGSRQELWRAVAVHLAAGTVTAAYGIVQSLTSHAGLQVFDLYQKGRAQGFFHEPDWFGYYLLSVFFPLLALMAEDAWPRHRHWLQAALATVGLALLLSQVRAAWAGMAVGLLGFLLWHPAKAMALVRRAWLPALGGTILFALAALLNPAIFESIITRFVMFADPNETANGYRLDMLDATMALIWENPFVGYGLGSWGPLVGMTGPNAVGTWNILVSAWFDSGLFGMAALLWLFGYVVWGCIKGARQARDPAIGSLLQGLALGFVALVVCNQFSDGSYFDFFWAYIGIAAAAVHLAGPAGDLAGPAGERSRS